MARLSRKENRELTRRRLRDAAKSEFLKNGVATASIDRIAESAGYSRGAFYSNYTNKNELALELLSETIDKSISQATTLFSPATPAEDVMRGLEAEFELVLSESLWWMLTSELRLEAERDRDFATRYFEAEAVVTERLNAMVGELARYAECADSVPIDYAVFVISNFTRGVPLGDSSAPVPGGSPGRVLVNLLYDLLGRPVKLGTWKNINQ